ncbi:MAG: sigma-54-dependent Fis family transcriptional regulator [Chitinophagaceae bacterium]|nr:sigma-54-dependent Fis family transcriptional regulator [Chitinophagaceae bacterium]
MQKILVIDDDRDMCLLLKRFLSKHGFEIEDANTAKKALELLDTTEYDLVLCDFRLDNMDGKTMLIKIKERYPHMPVIIITGYSDIKIAVEVMKLGAFDYITKPLFPDEIIVTIRKALESKERVNEPVSPAPSGNGTEDKKEKKPGGNVTISGQYIFGDSMAFKQILQQIELVGPTNYSVIIYGESGSGKEAIAQEIHKRSKRSHKPFIAIDCGALSRELAGSELFGHEKGAFTGALNQKIGSFELANGGTIFLDEIANLSYDIQVSLLRVVQERRMRRVGGTRDIELDVRIIIASNEPLWEASKKGKFREDLFHRFNEFSMTIPPLRERKSDIMVFARHFLNLTNEELNKKVKGFSPEVEEIFQKYVWYGNLRELKNVVKRATLLTDGEYIEDRSLPFEIVNFNKLSFDYGSDPSPVPVQAAPAVPATAPTSHGRTVLDETTLKAASIDAEYEMIIEALKQANFNKSKAAKLLNIDRKTLYNKMKQYQEFNNH